MNAKKLIALGAVLLLTIGLVGCRNNTSETPSNPQEVSGPLKKVGTFAKDSKTGKTILLAIKNYHNKSINTKSVTYYFKEARLLKIETTKKSQRANDENNFGKKLPKTYYEYQLDYALKNNSKKTVSSNGVALITPSGEQLLSNRGAIDMLVGGKIQPGIKKTSCIQAIAKQSDVKNITKYKLVSAEIVEDSGNYHSINSQTIINFNK